MGGSFYAVLSKTGTGTSPSSKKKKNTEYRIQNNIFSYEEIAYNYEVGSLDPSFYSIQSCILILLPHITYLLFIYILVCSKEKNE